MKLTCEQCDCWCFDGIPGANIGQCRKNPPFAGPPNTRVAVDNFPVTRRGSGCHSGEPLQEPRPESKKPIVAEEKPKAVPEIVSKPPAPKEETPPATPVAEKPKSSKPSAPIAPKEPKPEKKKASTTSEKGGLPTVKSTKKPCAKKPKSERPAAKKTSRKKMTGK